MELPMRDWGRAMALGFPISSPHLTFLENKNYKRSIKNLMSLLLKKIKIVMSHFFINIHIFLPHNSLTLGTFKEYIKHLIKKAYVKRIYK